MWVAASAFSDEGSVVKSAPSRGGFRRRWCERSRYAQSTPSPPSPPLEGEGLKTTARRARACFLSPTKKPAYASLFASTKLNDLSQRLDVRSQTALMPRRLILVDQATARITIHHRLGGLVRRFRAGLVFRGDRVDDFLDRGTQRRARGRIAGVALDGLTRTLLRRFDISQDKTPRRNEIRDGKRGVIVSGKPVWVNVLRLKTESAKSTTKQELWSGPPRLSTHSSRFPAFPA